MTTHTDAPAHRQPRTLAMGIVEALRERIDRNELAIGDKLPTEGEIMSAFGVSRTVVREAISKLQASGLVQTRHGIGSFVLGLPTAMPMHMPQEQLATLRDVVAVLELRIGLEAEAASLAARRRSDDELAAMRAAQQAFVKAMSDDGDAVAADRQLHIAIARATRNPHFEQLMNFIGAMLIPRSRINTARVAGQAREQYLRRVHAEHDSIVDAIANQDPEAARAAMRTHLSNSLERLRRADRPAEAG